MKIKIKDKLQEFVHLVGLYIYIYITFVDIRTVNASDTNNRNQDN